MGSILGGQTKDLNQNVAPSTGTGTQQQFYNALFNYGLTPTGDMQNGVPGSKLASLPGYGGQLTPDLGAGMLNGSQNVSQGVWNGWQSQAPGMSSLLQAAGGNTSQGPLSFLSQFLGGGGGGGGGMPGPGTPYGTGGGPGTFTANWNPQSQPRPYFQPQSQVSPYSQMMLNRPQPQGGIQNGLRR